MTDVTLNRHNVDHVSFTMTTTGSSVASATLDKLLLDPTKEYVLRVIELNAPTSGIPLFGFDTANISLNVPLFVIRKRVVGTSIVQFNNAPAFATDFLTVFRTQNVITNQIFFTTASFITSLAKHLSLIHI